MWGILQDIGEAAGRLFLHLLAIAILYPILVVATGFGWNADSYLWIFFHVGVALVIFGGGWLIGAMLNLPLLAILIWLGAAFSLLGAFDILKPLAMGIGLFGAGVADVILGLYAFLGVGAYGVASALAPGERMTVQAAEARARAALRGFVAVAAFQWAAGLFMFSFGRGVSWHLFWMLIFSVSILAHAMLAWDVGGKWGRSIIAWGAGLCFVVTLYVVLIHVGDAEHWWDTSTWRALQPFLLAAIFFAIYIAPAFLRKNRPIRAVCALMGLVLLVRAVGLQFSPSTWVALTGKDLRPYLMAGSEMPPQADRVEDSIRLRQNFLLEAWLEQEIGKIERASKWQELDALSKEAREGLLRVQRRRTGQDPVLRQAWERISRAIEDGSRKLRDP